MSTRHKTVSINSGEAVGDLARLCSTQLTIITVAGSSDQQEAYQNAKLALLLQLCQGREGAKHVLQANLMRAIELSGLFAADPELQIGKEAALPYLFTLLVSPPSNPDGHWFG